MKKEGSLIAAKRNEKGLTQAEVAEKAGMSRYALSCYETGKSLPTILVLKQLAPALDCDYKELIDPAAYEALEGSPLARMRKRYGYTQEELAQALGRTQKLVSTWELGRRLASAEQLQQMAELLECEAEDLI